MIPSFLVKREHLDEMLEESGDALLDLAKRSRRTESMTAGKRTSSSNGADTHRLLKKQSVSADKADELEPLSKYREAFVRTYQNYFTQFSTEEERVNAANQLFNTVKTPSELAKIALILKLVTVQPVMSAQIPDAKSDELPAHQQRKDSADIREKPAQNKLAREIELINHRIQKLYELRKLRELTSVEQDEVRSSLTEREELRKRLKKTQDAAIRAKRYRIRKATLMSTDSDFGSLDTAEPAIKFSRSNSTTVLSTSGEDSYTLTGSKNQLTLLTTTPEFAGTPSENSICLSVTPTPELSRLNISPELSNFSTKLENLWPASGVGSEIVSLDCRSSSVCSSSVDKNPNQEQSSTTEDENYDTINLQCQQCSALFMTLNEFIDHMRTTHLNNNTDFQCRICDRMFQTQQEKLIHLMEHYINTKPNYTCTKCKKNFVSATVYRQHFASMHTEFVFRCNLCLQVFTDNNVYQEHAITHAIHKTSVECVMCGVGFDNHEKFATHIQLVHERSDLDLAASSNLPLRRLHNNGSVDESVKILKNLKCFVCDEKYSNEHDLDTHRLLNHCKVPKGDRCAVCRKTLINLDEFFVHTKEHCTDLNEVSCVICRQTVRNETLLKLHGEYHLGEEAAQQAVCQICSKSISPNTLAQHILQHTFENGSASSDFSSGSFVCQCGQQFDDASELQMHSLVHLKEVTALDADSKCESFACNRCTKNFPSMSALLGHSHVHVNRKFSCKQCRQCFSTFNRLQSHQKRHLNEKDLKCQICDEHFESQDLLNSHIQAHEFKLHSSGSHHSTPDSSSPL